MRVGAQPSAAALLHRCRHGILGGRRRPGPRRVREDMHLRHTRRGEHTARLLERPLVLGRKADDHVGRQVEVRERLEAPEVGRGRVAATHRAQHTVVARLQRNVQMPGDGRRLPQRTHELVAHMVDLDRRQAQTLQARRRAGLAHEPRQRVAALTIAEAAEVDAREHDLAMALLDPPDDLPQDRAGARGFAKPRARAGSRRTCTRSCTRPGRGRTRGHGRAAHRPERIRSRRRRPRRTPQCPRLAARRRSRSRADRRTRARGWPHTRSRTRAGGCARPEMRPDETCARPRSSRSTC